MPRIAFPLVALAAAVPLVAGLHATQATSAPPDGLPAFRSYEAPEGVADTSGEPTLGVNLKTGNVMFISGLKTYRVNEFDKTGPGTSTWTDVSYPLTSVYTADPILELDTATGRTFVNQLMYSNPGSVMAYTDDDGATWTPVPYGSGVGANVDHQTVGVGKFVPGSPFVPAGSYPNAVYYCTNDGVASDCATSLDGGNTFSPAHPAYTDQDCAALHGHLKSGPDGTIYLPPDGCSGGDGGTSPAGVAVSEDGSLTWEVRRVPGSDSGDAGHPSLGVATDGTVYLAYGSTSDDGDYGPVRVAKSTDKGKTWTAPVALGTDLGVRASSFPIAVAGDPDRAAVGFLGTTAEGDPRNEASFTGRWDLYISTTYDGGQTWHTVNVTPDSPVQVGSICTSGLTCGNDRNLLDFNDMVLDERGNVVAGLADGCVKATCTSADREEHGLIVRQVSGTGLLKAFDQPVVVAQPSTSASPSAGPSATPSAAPTYAAPVPHAPVTMPSTGLDPALPLAAAGAATVALVAGRRRRRARAA
ncbi:MAG TPA: sialidase family protein [Mycobacteriales bacterium]|jgi:hypothetical protein|nr:sialidase family protein [Mycobacteriales bacterium]